MRLVIVWVLKVRLLTGNDFMFGAICFRTTTECYVDRLRGHMVEFVTLGSCTFCVLLTFVQHLDICSMGEEICSSTRYIL